MMTDKKETLLKMLKEHGQEPLLKQVNDNRRSIHEVEGLLKQLEELEKFYSGGLRAYLAKARELVQHMKKGEQDVPSLIQPPKCKERVVLDQQFSKLEEIARPHIGETAFVLVAGGLGERLGSKDIKISLICELMTGTSFMDLYLAYLRAFSELSGRKLNLFIMTSEDTHSQTVNYLAERDYDSYLSIHIEKQDKVPAFADLELNLDVNEELKLETKPHGHGDVHFMVKNSGITDSWKEQGVKYVYFIQDTNPFSLASLPSLLGMSIQKGFLLNFLATSRRPEEAIGALITDDQDRTYNIEYNILSNYFKSQNMTEPTDEDGFCKFPGNTNCFLINFEEYNNILNDIEGLKEFINPKLDKSDATKLLSSFRLECLMQDVAFSISDPKLIGVTEFPRSLCFSTCKNNLETGKSNLSKGISTETIIECENDIYRRGYDMLRFCGVQFAPRVSTKSMDELLGGQRSINDFQLDYAPRVFIHPSFGVLSRDIESRLTKVDFDTAHDFSMVLKGKVSLENCRFSSISAWIENTDSERELLVKNLRLSGEDSDVISFVPLDEPSSSDDAEHHMRGYKVDCPEKIVRILC